MEVPPRVGAMAQNAMTYATDDEKLEIVEAMPWLHSVVFPPDETYDKDD